MNTLNRVLVVLTLLALIVVWSAVTILPHLILPVVGAWFTAAGDEVLRFDPWLRLGAGIALATLFDALALLWIVLELLPRSRTIRVKQLSGGVVTLRTDSVALQVQYRLDPLPNVIRVKSRIGASGNKAKAEVEVGVPMGADVLQTATACVAAVRQALVDDLGLELAGDPKVHINVIVSPKTAAVVTPPPPPPSLPPSDPVQRAREQGAGGKLAGAPPDTAV